MQKASAFLSFLCAVHCLALPVLATLMASSAIFSMLHNPLIEISLLTPLGFMTFRSAYTQYKRAPRSLYFVGLLLGVIGVLVALTAHRHLLLGISSLYLAAFQWFKPHQATACSGH